MSEKKKKLCPECSQALWHDEEYDCWVCDQCDMEFYEDEDYDEPEQDEEEGW
jgi:ribosomal protein L37AE/L43A